MNESNELRSLFAEYASGEITLGQIRILEAALREDSMLCRDFIEYLNVDSGLDDLAALTSTEVEEIELEAGPVADATSTLRHETETSAGRSAQGLLAVVVVAIVLMAGASLWIRRPVNRPIEPVAMLVANVDATLLRNREVWNDRSLSVGKYQLTRGLLHLRFSGGVTVFLEAPAEFEPLSGRHLLLRSGRLSANVPPEGVGFTVETPEADVIDFGTEFSVDVSAGASEVHVFDGLVRVHPRSGAGDETANTVELRASQAVKIEDVAAMPVEIELATDRFIRTFDESRRTYSPSVKRLSPVAFYRMAIRDQGLACMPPQYSGVVLTGDGNRPPHASGVFAGGSLRVLADSIGRGGLVKSPPPLPSGELSLAAFVYLESRRGHAIVATNIQDGQGSFALGLNESGFLQATARESDGVLRSVSGKELLPLRSWCHIAMTIDGDHLRLYTDGQLIASSSLAPLAGAEAESLWFGTDSSGLHLWDGRIDEVALFDKALSNAQIAELYEAALEEIREMKSGSAHPFFEKTL